MALADLLPEPVEASCFLPRRVYGLDLESFLREAAALASGRSSVQRIVAEVIDLEPRQSEGSMAATGSGGYRLHLAQQAPLEADQVVLAWGNSALSPPLQPTKAIRHGWAPEATAGLAARPEGPRQAAAQ